MVEQLLAKLVWHKTLVLLLLTMVEQVELLGQQQVLLF
jgi:hypothetical protein